MNAIHDEDPEEWPERIRVDEQSVRDAVKDHIEGPKAGVVAGSVDSVRRREVVLESWGDRTMSSPEKAVNLYEKEDVVAWENTKAAAELELGENPREGEVLRELCRTYKGWDGCVQA